MILFSDREINEKTYGYGVMYLPEENIDLLQRVCVYHINVLGLNTSPNPC